MDGYDFTGWISEVIGFALQKVRRYNQNETWSYFHFFKKMSLFAIHCTSLIVCEKQIITFQTPFFLRNSGRPMSSLQLSVKGTSFALECYVSQHNED